MARDRLPRVAGRPRPGLGRLHARVRPAPRALLAAHAVSYTVAFVEQPWARALPPSESVAIGIREVARRVAPHARVVVFARSGTDAAETREEQGVEYRLVAAELDWRAMKAATPVRRLAP